MCKLFFLETKTLEIDSYSYRPSLNIITSLFSLDGFIASLQHHVFLKYIYILHLLMLLFIRTFLRLFLIKDT